MPSSRLITLAALALALGAAFPGPALAAPTTAATVPQGTQSDATYAASFAANHVQNVDATGQQTSCYRPEVPYFTSNGPVDGYTGMTACTSASTGEDTGADGPYVTQAGSNPGYPATTPMLVKDHSESDIRVDPTNPKHLIGSSKWIVSAEGYNHQLGFYESFDGGSTWAVQGHIPGTEGWTDATDPIGAFDGFGNYYSFLLPYQFFYNADGSHNYKTNPNLEPNPALPAEAVSVAVRPHGSTKAGQWLTTRDGHPDYVATYDSLGNEPDKQWMAIDTNPSSPHYNRVYLMWVDFHTPTPVPYVSYADAHADGTHTAWSVPKRLPTGSMQPGGDTYLLPHIAPDGTVYTTLTAAPINGGHTTDTIGVDVSTDGGASFSGPSIVASGITPPGLTYANTTFRDGIENTFAVGTVKVGGHYPLYASWEDYSSGVDDVVLSTSTDEGKTWSTPIKVNDNTGQVDEFQPNLATAPDGAVSVAFYDRRLPCAAAGSAEAAAAGLSLDTANPNYSGALPPYGATNYCVSASIQFYSPTLQPKGHNIRISEHTWDPQLNSPHSGSATANTTFIGDYFGNTTAGSEQVTTSVSTYDDGANPYHYQQQIVARIPLP
jgi:hypothetical protein